jgi:hypothetical protein
MLGLGLPVVTRPFKSLDQILYFQKAMGDYEIGISVLTSMYTGKPFLILSRGDDKYNRARFMGLSTSIGHTHGLKYETASSQDFSFAALNYEYSGNIFALSFSGSGKKMLSYFNRDSYLFRNTEDEGLINNLLNRYGVISDHDGRSIPPTAAKPSGQRQKGSAV